MPTVEIRVRHGLIHSGKQGEQDTLTLKKMHGLKTGGHNGAGQSP
jgi:hypothetical protein